MADANGSERARARHFDAASDILLVVEGVARAVDVGERHPKLLALRRISGGLGAVRDGAHDMQGRAVDSETARYLDCVYWWFAQLLRGFESALSETNEEARATGIVEAAAFASLYALAQLGPLRDGCPRDGAAAGACDRLHDDVQWLTWQLKDLSED